MLAESLEDEFGWLFSAQMGELLESLIKKGSYDDACDILWKVHQQAEKMASANKSLHQELLPLFNKLDNERIIIDSAGQIISESKGSTQDILPEPRKPQKGLHKANSEREHQQHKLSSKQQCIHQSCHSKAIAKGQSIVTCEEAKVGEKRLGRPPLDIQGSPAKRVKMRIEDKKDDSKEQSQEPVLKVPAKPREYNYSHWVRAQKQYAIKKNFKFDFRRDLNKLLKLLKDNNMNLFQNQAFKKHFVQTPSYGVSFKRRERKGRRDSFTEQGGKCVTGKATAKPYTTLPFENDSFFQTSNGNLLSIKHIYEHKQFWERIGAFFDIRVRQNEYEMLRDFYKLGEVSQHKVRTEIGYIRSRAEADPSYPYYGSLSREVRHILVGEEPIFQDAGWAGKDAQFIGAFVEDLLKEQISAPGLEGPPQAKSRERQKFLASQRWKSQLASQNRGQGQQTEEGKEEEPEVEKNHLMGQLIKSVVLVAPAGNELDMGAMAVGQEGCGRPVEREKFISTIKEEVRRGRTANEHVRSQLSDLGIEFKSKKARVPDEATYHIRELQKELIFAKGVNVQNFRGLCEQIKRKSEEEQRNIEKLRAGKEVQKQFCIYKKKWKMMMRQKQRKDEQGSEDEEEEEEMDEEMDEEMEDDDDDDDDKGRKGKKPQMEESKRPPQFYDDEGSEDSGQESDIVN